jgi:hypothetical protein
VRGFYFHFFQERLGDVEFGIDILSSLNAIAKEKRDFKRYRREKEYSEIEGLKNAVGTLYELSANWQAYEDKKAEYARIFQKDYELIGQFNKFPEVAATARDTVHWCKVVAYSESEHRNELIEQKKELGEKYRAFIKACDKHLDWV